MIKLVMFLICCAVSSILFIACLINGVRWAISVFAHRDCAFIVCAFKKSSFVLLGMLVFMGIKISLRKCLMVPGQQ